MVGEQGRGFYHLLHGLNPERILLEAVRRMVPRNRLGRQQMSKLKVYAGSSHPHQGQQPQELKPVS